MVWEEALSKLAPKLGLSDVGLRKICKRHNIPLPPQGYWARSPERRFRQPYKQSLVVRISASLWTRLLPVWTRPHTLPNR